MKQTILEQIKQGYSQGTFCHSLIFFKHFDLIDLERIRRNYEQNLAQCIADEIPTEEQILRLAEEEGYWSEAEELKILDLHEQIKNIRLSKARVFLQKQIAVADERIKKCEDQLKPLVDKKQILLFASAEYYARKWNNEYYLYLSCRTSEDCKKLFFEEQEFEELSDDELNKLSQVFGETLGKITIDEIKKTAINPLFLNLYALCDSVVDLFGGRVIDMTFFQSQLVRYAKEFKNIFETFPNVPERVQDKPDELIEWALAQANFRNTGKNPNSIVGMTAQDRENLGIKGGGSALQELRKKGTMTAEESAKFFQK